MTTEGHTMFSDGSCYSHTSRAVLLGDGPSRAKHIILDTDPKREGLPATFATPQQAKAAIEAEIGEPVTIVNDR